MKCLLILLAGLLPAIPAHAQVPAEEDAMVAGEPIRRYTVEVIIFRYTEDVSPGTEIFLPDAAVAESGPLDGNGDPGDTRDNGIPVFGDDAPVPAADAGQAELPPRWIAVPAAMADDTQRAAQQMPRPAGEDLHRPLELVLLDEADYSLGDAVRKFELLDAYETLMHFGWTQPAYAEEETPPIELQLFGEPPEGLSGTLTLYLSRYLHLVVDVALDAPVDFEKEVVEENSLFRFGDRRRGYEDYPEPELQPVRFHIQENRILRNGELRYFDHPKFGLLAKVTRVEKPDDAQALAGRLRP